jgi:hypothetical protein
MLLESLAPAAQTPHRSRVSQQSEFEQGRRQVAMFMARVAEFDQGEPLQLVQVRPTFGLNLEAKLVA